MNAVAESSIGARGRADRPPLIALKNLPGHPALVKRKGKIEARALSSTQALGERSPSMSTEAAIGLSEDQVQRFQRDGESPKQSGHSIAHLYVSTSMLSCLSNCVLNF